MIKHPAGVIVSSALAAFFVLAPTPATPIACSGEACGDITLSTRQDSGLLLQDFANHGTRRIKISLSWTPTAGSACSPIDLHAAANETASIAGSYCGTTFTAAYE